jgi:heptosyltransferase II
LKIDILRKIDRLAGISIIKMQSLAKGKRELPKNPKRILIIKLFGFGNFIFLSPVFKAIKKTFPKAELHILTFRQNKEICEMYSKYIDKVHTINYSTFWMGFSLAKFVARNRKKFDIAIDFEQFVRLSAIIGKAAAPRYFIGIYTPNSGKKSVFDSGISYKEKDHIVEEYYDVAKLLAKIYDKSHLIDNMPVLVKPESKTSNVVNKLLAKGKGKKLVGVCPGGRIDDAERRYPVLKFAKALDILTAKEKDVLVYFFGSKSDKPEIEKIKAGIKSKKQIVDASGLSLRETAYLASRMNVFVSNDTGPIHLAAAMGAYCVGLYGPSKEWIYGPYTHKRKIVRDEKHKPVRSNHNEKNVGWKSEHWAKPEKLYTEIKSSISR